MPPHPHHEAILAAFDRTRAVQERHRIRGGYSHIHGPDEDSGEPRCNTHSICVETFNGTVGFRNGAASRISHLLSRDTRRISAHNPLGCFRTRSEEFLCGITASEIVRHWGTFDEFAHDVVRRLGWRQIR
jgi:hypothetical protein